MKKVLKIGAEAEVYLTEFLGYKVLVKRRLSKPYRIPEVDKMIKEQRTRKEVKIMHLAKTLGVNTPAIVFTDIENGIIVMEFIEGSNLKELIEGAKSTEAIAPIIRRMGELVGIMHKNDIIHGDLTPANIIVDKKSGEIFFIDFGLSEISHDLRLKAVDIHVFKESLKTLTDYYKDYMKYFIEGYSKTFPESSKVLALEKEIERMGRYVTG
ncbi:MAG: Kae1-associated kinase Bud32 [Thermoplasmata archaeon]|nr:Kae1-associated serine/threonine protein kinase [Euryarchaeota archaeon]RLF67151.1 MAG: Kae1-associated kinase Bud32 [Thermoplasmata archaeon]